jgi:hypothetical protein
VAALKVSLEIIAIMEMQYFIPTEGFLCDEDLFGYDSCIFQAVQASGPSCVLPYQNLSLLTDMQYKICKTHADGYASFQQFQLNYDTCKVRCSQLNTVFNYYMPQYLRDSYLHLIQKEAKFFAYYLYLPSAIKVSKASPSYGFITFIAEVAGWYNLFLGGSVFAMWKVLGTKILWTLAKIQGKLSELLSPWQNVLYLLMSSGVLIYVFLDCITILVLNPVGSNFLLTNHIPPGLCLSICLPQYTSVYTANTSYPFLDIANTTAFWVNGSNLRNKIFDLSVIMQEGDVIKIWNTSQSSTTNQTTNLFSIFNIVSSNLSVDFCHTVDLSLVPGNMRMVRVRAVNDITLVVHLSGQLLAAKAKFAVANTETAYKIQNVDTIFLYNSEIRLQLEETSFQNVTAQGCKNYNTTWTFDMCVLDFVTMEMANNTDLPRRLLLPSNNYTVQQGIEKVVLQSLYAGLMSHNFEAVCLPDCKSLVVNMKSVASPIRAVPMGGITKPPNRIKVPTPLPPLLVEVNITVPSLNKINQVIFSNCISSFCFN